ncbi:ABC transporter ATP-binding protein [Metabacillus dongyingensis]|uniref:ABC transporter ATP-binding protein n=1 Tax=Metabacillus dongyingensis TaxID=2874282 RepID=UPI001CBCB7E1|nr:ABC transporter ATP-binding protein [Metabacillus dongyingensis]UAL50254.1 ABC transporter ATP-binding protein/permease [Metabacillus dongyingensis]
MNLILYFLKQIQSYAGKRLYINLLGTVFISLLDGVGILLLIPMISITGIIDFNVGNTPFNEIFSFFDRIPSSVGLPFILLIFVLIVILQNFLHRHITIQNIKIQHGFFRHLRVNTYHSLLHANWAFFIKNRKSDLINLLTTEVARSSAGTHSLLQFLAFLIFTVIQIGLAFFLSPSITFFLLLCGALIVFLNRKFLKMSLALGKKNYSLGKEYLAGITDQMNGIKDIKSNTLEKSKMNWFLTVTKGMQDEQIEYTTLRTMSQLYYKVASSILIAVFIYIAVNMFHAQAGELMLIIVIFSRLWPRVAGIQSSLEQIATMLPSFHAVKNLQNESRIAVEFKEFENLSISPIQIKKEIECKNVYFRYSQNSDSYALEGINVVIPSNKMTAFVGKSGAGKSTLIDILMGLNLPEKGQVLIDGTLLTSENLLSMRKAVSYVPQDPFLFNASIKENLLMVESEATDEEIWKALEFSSAAEFVKKLPKGLDTLVGDRGIRLSGGERQRIVLARAILRKPSILVLDEATSALDTENEANIQKALERLKGSITIIVIAHRLSTIRNADQVIVLEQGNVIQKGEFGQLAKDKKNLFGKLLNNQKDASL